ncbi:MAG: hypothetical protein GWO11_00855, partial [Desulfuromonadales bacterium]|nr:hypothetical protein [Desulfuromonadales bacterium]NIR33062.1 hypothetical protein [Desulfuromonadales bacterium]NIS39300.1 hypothetical protein [Desulfuromonadales bacterium]
MDLVHENMNPPELLETLHGYPFLADFSLSMHSPDGRPLALRGNSLNLCRLTDNGPACGNDCRAELQRAGVDVMAYHRPLVVRCPLGLLKAIVPLQHEQTEIGYLVCSGKREKLVDLDDVRSLVKDNSGPRDALMSEWRNLPAASREDIESIADKTHELLNSLLCTSFSSFSLHKNLNRLKSIAGITAEIDRVKTHRALRDILDETLSILFDVPKIVYLLPCENRPGLFETGDNSDSPLAEQQLATLHRMQGAQARLVDGKKIREILPFLIEARKCYSIPLTLESEPLGHLFLCNGDLYPHDLVLIDLLIGRVCAKLLHLKRSKDLLQERALSTRLLK